MSLTSGYTLPPRPSLISLRNLRWSSAITSANRSLSAPPASGSRSSALHGDGYQKARNTMPTKVLTLCTARIFTRNGCSPTVGGSVERRRRLGVTSRVWKTTQSVACSITFSSEQYSEDIKKLRLRCRAGAHTSGSPPEVKKLGQYRKREAGAQCSVQPPRRTLNTLDN